MVFKELFEEIVASYQSGDASYAFIEACHERRD
jgi:hypothetical protein